MPSTYIVSIIIPFYNSEQFLKDAIESVLEQTYNHWELLLIDDGSTDNSTEIALDYSNKHPERIYYLQHDEHKNKGACASRNLGIKHSKGKYIALLDSDDIWLPGKLEDQVGIISKDKTIDVIFGLSEYWYSWSNDSNQTEKNRIPELGVEPNIIYEPYSLLNILFPLGEVFAPCPSVLLMTKEIVERIGGFEESFTGMYQFYEDQVFLSKLYVNARIYPVGKCWIKYRIHPDSCSSKVKEVGMHHRVKLHYFYWLKEYLNDNGFKNESTLAIVNANLSELKSKIENDVNNWKQIADNRKKEIDKLKKQIAVLKKKSSKNDNRNQIVKYKNLNDLSPSKIGKQATRLVDQYLLPSVYNFSKVIKSSIFSVIGNNEDPFSKARLINPVSKQWGWDRGMPIDRYYIEKFLRQNSECIKGDVLEINDNKYTKKFGREDVLKSEVLDIDENNKDATIIADLQKTDNLESNRFDCIILTQTLQLTYDYDSVIANCKKILKDNGVLLATFPGITKILINKPFKWYWSFSNDSAVKVFSKYFKPEKLKIDIYGNVLSASAFLYGLSAEELKANELNYHDPHYEVIIAVKAKK